VLNGLSVGVGLACLTAIVGALAGMPAAITAASGASTASVADTVCAPQAKWQQMLPAVLSTLLVAALVALSHPSLLWLTVVVLLTTFTSIFWMAWGKRGGPQTFVMILTLVFQMAAFSQQPMSLAQAGQHLLWVGLGAAGMAAWSALSIRVLARRYRTLALADSLQALAKMMRSQAQWTQSHQPGQANGQREALLTLIAQQAGIADVFQSARDLLYSQAEAPGCTPLTRRQIEGLIHIVNLRDVVQACQLDLDRLPDQAETAQVVARVAGQLMALADRLDNMALCWRTNRRWPPMASPSQDMAWPDSPDAFPVLASLGRRCRHMQALVALIAQSHDEAHQPAHQAAQDTILRTLVSPTQWTWGPLKAQLRLQSPVLRYAMRATLAMACADALAHVLPWTSHPHWLLMTVAVVMRGNLEQTLARRDARVQGTLVGCLIASALLSSAGHTAWLFLALAIALSLAHGFVLINYRVTAAAGAVLALVQGHLFNPTDHPALLDAAERLGDTLIGAALAWAFSYVLPSWERQQLPRLAQRLMQAQAHYTHHALRWHLAHPRSSRRSLARREVYDVLWLLSQSLQRMAKEPRRTQGWATALESLLVHSNRLISQLSAIKGLLTVRHQELDEAIVAPALQKAEAQIRASLQGEAAPAVNAASPVQPAPTAMPDDISPVPEADSPRLTGDLNHWLMLRLAQTVEEARLLNLAAAQLNPDRETL